MHVKGRKKGCLFKTISQALITLKQEIGKMNDSFRNYLNQWNRIYKEEKLCSNTTAANSSSRNNNNSKVYDIYMLY